MLTIAVADCVLHNKDLAKTIWEYGRAYPNRGYGGRFYDWLQQDQPQPYGSFGNGSAMRVSAVGFAYDDMETVLEVAKQTAVVTHDHPEGVKGAQATAAAIFMARQGSTKQEMKDFCRSNSITILILRSTRYDQRMRSTKRARVRCRKPL